MGKIRKSKKDTALQKAKFEDLMIPIVGERWFLLNGEYKGTQWHYHHQFTENYWMIWQISRVEAINE